MSGQEDSAITGAQWIGAGVVTLIPSVLAIISSAYVLLSVWRTWAFQKKDKVVQFKKKQTFRQASYISMSDLLCNVGFLIGAISRVTAVPITATACNVSGFLINTFDMSSCIWTTFLAVNLFLYTLNYSVPALQKAERGAFAIAWGFPVLMSVLAATGTTGTFQHDGVWCNAINSYGDSLSFYGCIMAAHFIIIIFLQLTKAEVLHITNSAGAKVKVNPKVVAKLELYLGIFHCLWIPAYLVPVQQIFDPFHAVFPFYVLQALFRPTRGFANAYCNVSACGFWPLGKAMKSSDNGDYDSKDGKSTTFTDLPDDSSLRGTTMESSNRESGHDRMSHEGTVTTPRAGKVVEKTLKPRIIRKNPPGTMKRWILTALKSAFIYVLLIAMLVTAGAGQVYARRYTRVSRAETESTVIDSVKSRVKSDIEAILRNPLKTRELLVHEAFTGGLRGPLDLYQWGDVPVSVPRTLEERTYQQFELNPSYVAMYAGLPDRTVLKIHRETADHVCTQMRQWTELSGANKNTTRTDMCRPIGADYWDSSHFWDSANQAFIAPSFSKAKNYDIFGKSWYKKSMATGVPEMTLDGNLHEEVLWDGPESQSRDPNNCCFELALNMVFKVRWPFTPDNAGKNGGPEDFYSVHKLKFEAGTLNDVMANADAGEHGEVYIVRTDGLVVAAPDKSHQRLIELDEEDGIEKGKILTIREAGEHFDTPLQEITDSHLNQTESLTFVSKVDPDSQISISPFDAVPDWRLVLLTNKGDYLKESSLMTDTADILANICVAMVVFASWKWFADYLLKKQD